MDLKRFRPSPAGLLAAVALVAALAGTSFAAAPSGSSTASVATGYVYAGYDDGPTALNATERTVVYVVVPGGDLAVSAKVFVEGTADGLVKCGLQLGSSDDLSKASVEKGKYVVVTNTVVGTTSSQTTAVLRCSMPKGTGNARWMKITAIKAAGITYTRP